MKIRISILFCFLSQVLIAQEFTGKVVQDNDLSTPIPFAEIFFIELETAIQTDSLGEWKVSNIPEGFTKIEVLADGFQPAVLDFNFKQGTLLEIRLQTSHRHLDHVIVSTSGILQRESITNVESRSLTDLNKIPSTSLGEAITNIPGVYQASLGTGISKPTIRGLSGNSVVTYLNGLRIENQQWGADHGLPITELGIGRVEVIKGPASLLYGSDAMGGVVYFVDEPYALKNTYSISAQTRFESNTLGTSNQVGFKYNKGALRFNAYGSYGNFADYRLANGKFAGNSRFNQSAGKMALGYNKGRWVFNLRYNYIHARAGIPGHTHDSIPDLSSFQVLTQKRSATIPAQVVNNHFTLIENTFFFKRMELRFSVGNTNNHLQEFEEKVTLSAINMNLNTTTHNVRVKVDVTDQIEVTAGTQGLIQFNQNNQSAEEFLIPDALMNDLGGYALLNAKHKKWRFQIGGRYDNRQIKTTSQFLGVENFQRTYQGVNYSAGLARLGENSTLRLNISSGFRAPHTSELLSNGFHHGAFRYEIGDSNLDTEKATQIDFSLGLHYEDFEFIVNPYYMLIRDYIYIAPTNSIIANLPVFQYSQAEYAQLFGGEMGIHYHPHKAHWLHLESSFSTVFAEDEFKRPLPLIPQTRINSQVQVEFEMKGSFTIENLVIQHIYHFEQNRVGVLESVTSGYNLLNIGANLKWGEERPILIAVGVKNALNQQYFNHLSFIKNIGLHSPGFNAYISLKYQFENKL